MRAGLTQLLHQLFIEALEADTIAELKAEFQSAIDYEITNALRAVKVHVEYVVFDHELANPVGIVQELDFLPDQFGLSSAELLPEEIMAVDAAIGTASTGEDLDRSPVDRRKAHKIDVEVALDIQQVISRHRDTIHVDIIVARKIPNYIAIPAKPQSLNSIQILPSGQAIQKVGKDVLPLADANRVDALFLHHLLRHDGRVLPAEDYVSAWRYLPNGLGSLDPAHKLNRHAAYAGDVIERRFQCAPERF